MLGYIFTFKVATIFSISTLYDHKNQFWDFTPCAVLCVHSQYLIILTIARWWAGAWIEGWNKGVLLDGVFFFVLQ